ncbi:MAG: hypothetical protein NT004_10075 [Bacteroidetes bacterium]|nr:hypothetical protein [Bacteroidota bacterium]
MTRHAIFETKNQCPSPKTATTTSTSSSGTSSTISWKETHIRESRIESGTIEKPVYKVTGFQNFLIWSGGIAWAIIVIMVGINLRPKTFFLFYKPAEENT